jgi:hypothetical protein
MPSRGLPGITDLWFDKRSKSIPSVHGKAEIFECFSARKPESGQTVPEDDPEESIFIETEA